MKTNLSEFKFRICSVGDILSKEQQYCLPSTSQATLTSKLQVGDVIDVVEAKETEETTSSTTNLQHVTKMIAPAKIKQKPKSSSAKQFNSKTRRYIKQCTNIALNHLGEPSTERLQNAQKYADNHILLENFESLNKKAKAFLLMQIKLARKNKMARRFSLEDKVFALALMKQSPKGYKLLEKMFALPNKRTLARLSEKIVFECGINQNIFDHIKMSTKNWDIKKKLCTLVFDEVALTPHLVYNESKDKINGFVEIAGERKQKYADHALVFMVRGVCSSWRQSIAYYFCEGTISAAELENILKEIIPRLSETGLKPLGLVCYQGSTFRSCFKNLKASTARLQSPQGRKSDSTIHIAGHDLFIFHDPLHLLKGIRNNFLEKDILYGEKRASWKDILYVYDLDNKSGHTRALPKLTAQHVDPKQIKKMKVKSAAQVLSARTAAMLYYTHSVHKQLNASVETMEDTATIVTFFDDLFDSVNGSPGGTKGKLRCAVKPNSPHHEFWQESIRKLKVMKFIDTNSKLAKKSGKPRLVRVPSLEGWITTLESFLRLSKLLFSEFGVEYFYSRFINQDPLENFFGRIRAINYRNTNPDANTFMYAFKSLVLSNILSPHSKFSNCEEDDGETLFDLNYLFYSPSTTNENATQFNVVLNAPSSSKSLPKTLIENVIGEKVKVQTCAYTVGYLCRKINKKINCKACENTCVTKEVQGIHKYIQYREHKRLKNNNLVYPNEKILRLYNNNAQIVHSYLNAHGFENNVKSNLKTIITNLSDLSWLGCQKHKKIIVQFYLTLVIRLQCHNWCNIINRILDGKIEEKYVINMQDPQKSALRKYKTNRFRKKVINK